MTVLSRFRLDGRVAIVTGGTRGLGKVAAHALSAVGARVVITSRNLATAENAAEEMCDDPGEETLGLACDVRDPASVRDLIARTVDHLGRLDILVNNAGTTQREPLEKLSEAAWDEVVDVNLKGTWLCCQAAAAVMRPQRWGRIVNLASMLAHVGLPNRSPYIAAKGGVVALTRALAVELAPDNITVNALAPGPFLTAMHDPVARANMIAQIPLGRFGDPGELGPAIVYLASEASSFVTGSVLTIDGGYTAR